MSILHTERLRLRPLREDDAQAMYDNWTCDERVARYCRWHPHRDVEGTKQLLKMYLDEAAGGFDFRWGIELRETGDLIGVIDVVGISDDGKTATIGYVLAHAHWNRGYVTEALRRVLSVLLASGFTTVKAEHHIDNPASGRVMEKCGMTYIDNACVPGKFGSDELVEVKQYEIKAPQMS